jgi:pimeloyl-ACP methyl ester carboxylesterase
MMTSTRPAHRTKDVYTIDLPHAELVVDVWQAQQPTDATPILLVHGWGGTGNYWKQTAFALSETATVYVPDLPGTGRSQPVSEAQNMFDQVATIAHLLDEFQLDRVQIVGHSMGGAMSVLLSAEQPERVERLVLTSLTFFMTREQEAIYARVMNAFELTMRFRPKWLAKVPGMTRVMGAQYFYRLPDDDALLQQGLQDYLDLDRPTAMACAKDATNVRIKNAGAHIQAPTLLIAARQDNMMPLENVNFTLDIIPDSDVCWIEECGHLPMVEKPDEYIAILRDFLVL